LEKISVAFFVVIWQNLSNYGLTRNKRFISIFIDKCAISYFFYLHLMLLACVQRFDVTGTVQNFLGIFGNLNKALVWHTFVVSFSHSPFPFPKTVLCQDRKGYQSHISRLKNHMHLGALWIAEETREFWRIEIPED
jgi:hypothetical protein